MAKRILLLLAEDRAASSATEFRVLRRVDEYDCLAFAAALASLGHRVCYANWLDIDAPCARILRLFDATTQHYVAGESAAAFDLVFIYKMEGFLRDQERFFAMLGMFERSCERVVNDPATIRHNIDKRYLAELSAHGIDIIPSYWIATDGAADANAEAAPRAALDDAVRAILDSGDSAVLKRLRGERGEGIVRLDPVEHARTWRQVCDALEPRDYFVQRYMPGIRAGERSLAYLGRSFQHAVIKHPNASDPREFRCNESLGGSVAPYSPNEAEHELAQRVLAAYEALGYSAHFNRIDLIESQGVPLLMEAELLNPSIYANYLGRGERYAQALAAYFTALMR